MWRAAWDGLAFTESLPAEKGANDHGAPNHGGDKRIEMVVARLQQLHRS